MADEPPKRGRIVGRLLNFLAEDDGKPAQRKPAAAAPRTGAAAAAAPPRAPVPDPLDIAHATAVGKLVIHPPPGHEEIAKKAADQVEQMLKAAFQGANKFKRLDDNSFLLTSSKLSPEQVRQIAQMIALAVAAKLAAAAGIKPTDLIAVNAMPVERGPDWPATADKQEALINWGVSQDIAEQHPDWGISRDRPEIETDWGQSQDRPESETDWGQSHDRPESATEWGQSHDRPEAEQPVVVSRDRAGAAPAVAASGERAAAAAPSSPTGTGSARAMSLAEAAAAAAAEVGGLPPPPPGRGAAPRKGGPAGSDGTPATESTPGWAASQDRPERDQAFAQSQDRTEAESEWGQSQDRLEAERALVASRDRTERENDGDWGQSQDRPEAERALVASRDRAERENDGDWGQSRDRSESDPALVTSKDRPGKGAGGQGAAVGWPATGERAERDPAFAESRDREEADPQWGQTGERKGPDGVDYVIGSREREAADVDWGRTEERKDSDVQGPAATAAPREEPVLIRFRPFWNAKRGAIQGCVVQGERRDRDAVFSGEIAYPMGCDEATAAKIDDRILRTAIDAITTLRTAGTPALLVAPVRYLSLFGRERHKFIPMLRNLPPEVAKLLMIDVVAVPADKSPSLLGKDIELFKAFSRFIGLRVSLGRPQFFKASDSNAGFAGGDAQALGMVPGAPPLDAALLADFAKKAKAPGYESYVWNLNDAALIKAAAEGGVTLISGDPIGPATDQPTGARPFKLG
jgi:hypothetical protein